MPKFHVKISNNKLRAGTAKLVRRLLLIFGISFALVNLILFLPISTDLIAVVFAGTSIFTISLIFGLAGFAITYLIIQFGGNRYRGGRLNILDNLIELQHPKHVQKIQLSELLISEPEFETSKPELKLTTNQENLYIRFKTHYELADFRKLVGTTERKE